MKTPQKHLSRFGFFNRFLTGLIVALSLSLLAFEWTTERSESTIRILLPAQGDIEEMLPPVTYRTEALKKPETPTKTDQIKVVQQIFEAPKTEPVKKKAPEGTNEDLSHLTNVDLNQYGMGEEELPYEDPTPYVSIQQYAHYEACIGLWGEASKECSEKEIIQKVYDNFKVTPMLRDLGVKQGSLVSFTIDEEGNVSQIEILQSTSKAMSKAVTKAIEALPQMIPAQQQGHAVAIQMQLPIVLHLK